jgi:REP element-mobilizing transposase RayT
VGLLEWKAMVYLRRYKGKNIPFFITTSTYRNQIFFLDETRCEVVIDYIYRAKVKMLKYLLAFTLMPDHLHLLMIPKDKYTISDIMLFIKKGSSRVIHIRENTTGHLWTKRFFDKGIRSEKKLIETIEYIHNNPVKAGLVSGPEDYLFSSANPSWKTDLESYFDIRMMSQEISSHLGGKVGLQRKK